ncbi:protein PSK SIMULATOR 1 [Typha angustifolia]|uniref:protein PSK SIMULATOR 1 n=1 Tax=Typha angustifolia TaxID=59011 RepID=UPI003C2D0505
MARETWITRVRSAFSAGLGSVRSPTGKKTHVGILAFEVAGLMSRLLHIHRSLSDAHIARLRHDTLAFEGVRKIVSDDDAFLLALACAEFTDALRLVVDSTSVLAARCVEPCFSEIKEAFKLFADTGSDVYGWVFTKKEMETRAKKMDKYISSTATLHKEMEELSDAEHALKKLIQCNGGCNRSLATTKLVRTITEIQEKILWQRQEVKYKKQTSLWSCTFDAVVCLLTRSAFTVLARVKQVFGIGYESHHLPRSLSTSPAVVYPSSDPPPPCPESSPENDDVKQIGFLESISAMLAPPPPSLGSAALAQHYANLIIVVEKMIRTPRAVGDEARDDLYAMLPASLRQLLRTRLRGVGRGVAADAELAVKWREALASIMDWLGPMAHATVRWQGERSFEQRRKTVSAHAATAVTVVPRANVLLLQTLHFAHKEKTEAAIAELLVGLNYIWRFEREMSSQMLLLLNLELTASKFVNNKSINNDENIGTES